MVKHYISLDSSNRVIKGFSTDFEEPTSTDICICEDGGRHFELNSVINPTLLNMDGTHIYKYIDNKVTETTEEERKAELVTFTVNKQPNESDLLMLALADLDKQREADKIENQLALAELAETIMGGTK